MTKNVSEPLEAMGLNLLATQDLQTDIVPYNFIQSEETTDYRQMY